MNNHARSAIILPNPSLITEPAKSEDMISISSQGLCGEDVFRFAPIGKRQIIGPEGR